MVEATVLGLFLYRPVDWCFLRGMKHLSFDGGLACLLGCSLQQPLVNGEATGSKPRDITHELEPEKGFGMPKETEKLTARRLITARTGCVQ